MVNKNLHSTVIIGYGYLAQIAFESWPKHLSFHAITRSQPKKLCKKLTWHSIDIDPTHPINKNDSVKIAMKNSPWINFWLPPKSSPYYLKILEDVLNELHSNQLLTFTSSTSVFGTQSGLIDEDTPNNPDSDNGKLLVEAEQLIQKKHQLFHIVRLAGLIDSQRHPIHTLQGKKNLHEGSALVNLVHTEDAVNFIYHLATHPTFSRKNIITNICSNTHLPKNIFYPYAAKQKNLPLPEYLSQNNVDFSFKKVSNTHLWKKYHYQLKHLHVI